MNPRSTPTHKLRLAILLAGLFATASASAVTYTYRVPAKGVVTPSAGGGGGAAVGGAEGFWVIRGTVSSWNSVSLDSDGFAASCPAGGIDPTGSSAAPSTTPGEPFNTDSFIELGWESPAEDYAFAGPASRTWCFPANQSDVGFTGSMSSMSSVGGSVSAQTQAVAPTQTGVTVRTPAVARNLSTVISANGQTWSILVSSFYTETANTNTGTSVWLDGRKFAVGKTPNPTFSYFGLSPSLTRDGYSYTNTSGTISFAAPAPACKPWVQPAALGTGGALSDITTGGSFGMLLKQDGSVWMTGWYNAGEFGICTTGSTTTWTRVANGVSGIGAVGEAAYVLKPDGTAWMAGYVTSGSDGMGDPSSRQGPRWTQIASNVKQIDGVNLATAYLKNDGTLWYSGNNSYGTAGQGPASLSQYTSFVQVDSNVAFFRASASNLYYVKTDKSLWTTGSSSYYKLGDSTSTGGFTSTPNKLPYKLADNVADAFGTGTYSAYLTPDGKVYAAGYDGYFQFGKGAFTNLPTFTQIGETLGPIMQITGSDTTIKLLTTSGDVYASGTNGGTFGDGTTANSNVFIKVASGIKKLEGPRYAVTTGGTLLATGNNSRGTFGNGTTTNTTTYTPVSY